MKQAGEVVKRLREQNGDTQTDLANKMSVTQSMVAHFESGRRDLRHSDIVQICKIYKADPKVFF